MSETKEITVDVKQEYFENSFYYEGRNCALAQGLKKRFPKSEILVKGTNVDIDEFHNLKILHGDCDKVCVTYDNPKNIRVRIEVPNIKLFK